MRTRRGPEVAQHYPRVLENSGFSNIEMVAYRVEAVNGLALLDLLPIFERDSPSAFFWAIIDAVRGFEESTSGAVAKTTRKNKGSLPECTLEMTERINALKNHGMPLDLVCTDSIRLSTMHICDQDRDAWGIGRYRFGDGTVPIAKAPPPTLGRLVPGRSNHLGAPRLRLQWPLVLHRAPGLLAMAGTPSSLPIGLMSVRPPLRRASLRLMVTLRCRQWSPSPCPTLLLKT